MFPNEEHNDDDGDCKSCKAEKTEWCCAKTKINTRKKLFAAFCFYNVAAAWLAALSTALWPVLSLASSRAASASFRTSIALLSSF